MRRNVEDAVAERSYSGIVAGFCGEIGSRRRGLEFDGAPIASDDWLKLGLVDLRGGSGLLHLKGADIEARPCSSAFSRDVD
jgi:hypothetical protein